MNLRVTHLPEQSFALSHVQIRQGRSMEDSGGSALGDVHFSAQSSKKLCCNRCVLKYDKMQVGAKEFENMQPGVNMIIDYDKMRMGKKLRGNV